MKLNKLKITALSFTPIVFAPIGLTSCSVYKDLMNGYTPSYEQLSAQLSLDEAINRWIAKATELSDFIKEEIYWSCSAAAKEKFSREVAEGFYYDGEFTIFSTNVAYTKVTNKDQHRISYKMNCEIEEKDKYYLEKEYYGYGTIHYSLQWECKDLAFDVVRYHDENLSKDFWLVKPVKFNATENSWTDYLDGEEVISFNLRCIYETYGADGIQLYGYEATEAAIMNKELSYTTKLGDLLNNFCCFYSYYLDDCSLKK